MFSYFGGKSRISSWILPMFPEEYNQYIEPFSGAFWVYLKSDVYKQSNIKRIVYNDTNKHLVNIFTCANKDYKEFVRALKEYKPKVSSLYLKFKKEVLENKIHLKDFPNYDLAAKYIYVQTHTFSGSKFGAGTNMVNDKDTNKYLAVTNKFENNTNDIIEKIQAITDIECLDYSKVIKEYDSKESLFYIDPPYKGNEKAYMFSEFAPEDHEELSNILLKVKGKFLLSYYYFQELKDWFPYNKFDWKQKGFKKVSSNSGIKSTGTEIIIKNI